MDDEDTPQHQHRWKGFAIGGGLVVALIVGVLATKRGSEPDQASTARAMQARAQPDAAAEPAPPSRTYPHPVEFEIEVNNQVHDVIEGELISLDHGSLKLEPVAEWVAYGKGFHVVHAPSISVALDDQAMIASAQAATAKIYVLDPAATDADARVLLTSGFVGTGQTGAARPVKRVIAGKPRTGEHLETKFGLEIETFVVPVAALKLGVIVFHEEDANLEQLDEMLASLRASTPPPRAMFQASLGPTTEEVPLVLDTATELSPNLSVTLRRRKYSLRTLGGLTFEYPRTLAVNVTDKPPLTVVTLQNERMSVQLVPMPAPIPIAQLAKTIAGRQLGEVKRTFGGRPLVGTKVQMELELTAEVYALELGGRQISVTLTYRKSDEPAAIDAATPIISSVR